jgi:acyl-CoA thioester hydrolase
MQVHASTPCVLEEFAFFHPIQVPWANVDQSGVVYHPHYFVYFQTAMTEYLRALDLSVRNGLAEFGIDMFTVNMSANFREPALYDDEIKIGVRVAYLGKTSVKFAVAAFRRNHLLAEGSVTYVTVGRSTRAPSPLPEAFIERVARFERTLPLRKE